MKKRLLLLWAVSALFLHGQTAAPADDHSFVYNILDFGAPRDNSGPSTEAINRAVETCSKNGGGTVVVPPGTFTSGTIILKDNVNLRLESGATLYASDDRDAFPEFPLPESPLIKNRSALIYANGATNIGLSGQGVIEGRGREAKKNQQGPDGKDRPRVKNLLFVSCRHVHVSGVALNNSNHWNQHYLNCEDVTVTGINVFNHAHGNNDGIDIDGCRRFVLSDSIIDADDDGIVLKSTGPAPCEDIVVANCVVSSHANAIKCGTESLGGFQNIAISNCVVKPSRSMEKKVFSAAQHGIGGIALIIVDGGVMDGVTINNIVIQGTECPLYVRLGDRGRKVDPAAPALAIGAIRNVQISNVLAYGTGNYAASITGVPSGKIENVYLDNIRLFNRGGLSPDDAYDPLALPPMKDRHDFGGGPPNGKYIADYSRVVEDEKGYPQPTVWRNLPSYGLFIRHVRAISITNLTLAPQGPDPRPPVIAVDVGDLRIKGLRFPKDTTQPSLLLKDVSTRELDPDIPVKSAD